MKKILFLLFSSLLTFSIYSQELNCKVDVLTDAKVVLSSTDKEVIEQMKQSMNDFLNNTKWTKDKFSTEERINCVLQFQITGMPSVGVFTGTIQVQCSRPVFNSSYNTTLLNIADQDVTIPFQRNTVLLYTPNQFRDNLTSILAYYAYLILGMDYDSFSLKGGSPFFVEAQQIVTNAQSAGFSGWMSNETSKKNRYWIIDNVQQQLFEPLRECNYEYHRKGLDKLYENKSDAKKAIFVALDKLSKIASSRPSSINVTNFVQSKSLEIKNLYFDATQQEKTEMVNLLKKLDPVNASKYQEILN
jgi:hypothetical protein